MAVSDKAINFLQGTIDRGRPIPGQSLVNSPEQPYNWEKPTEYTSPKEAMFYVFETLTVPETTANILVSLSKGVGIIDIASITLYSGFLEGKWNPDLMMLLMEPTMYMIMALAEKANIDYNLESGDNEESVEISSDKQIETIQKGITDLEALRQQAASRVSPMSVPQDVKKVIEKTELSPSLLEKVQTESKKSLLSKEG